VSLVSIPNDTFTHLFIKKWSMSETSNKGYHLQVGCASCNSNEYGFS